MTFTRAPFTLAQVFLNNYRGLPDRTLEAFLGGIDMRHNRWYIAWVGNPLLTSHDHPSPRCDDHTNQTLAEMPGLFLWEIVPLHNYYTVFLKTPVSLRLERTLQSLALRNWLELSLLEPLKCLYNGVSGVLFLSGFDRITMTVHKSCTENGS